MMRLVIFSLYEQIDNLGLVSNAAVRQHCKSHPRRLQVVEQFLNERACYLTLAWRMP